MKLLSQMKRLPLSVALFLLVVQTGLAQGQASRPDCWVLSAGVDNYPNANRLQGCLADARNTSAAFLAQRGKKFGAVHVQTLLDGNATRSQIVRRLDDFSRVGKAGDFVVLFLSGHGARNGQGWHFLTHDFDPRDQANTTLTDRQILDACDVLVRKGKKVVIIVDACFAGQLNITARNYLARYRDAKGGGLILMVSSGADQTSMALGAYSAFAKAFADSMAGHADLNRDGKLTLAEIHSYSRGRTNDLIRQRGMSGRQDSEMAWSPSISHHMSLALLDGASIQLAKNRPYRPAPTPKRPAPVAPTRPVTQAKIPAGEYREWIGTEDLAGFGLLTFRLYAGGKAAMIDRAGTTLGTWQQDASQMTLHFSNGRIVYSGTISGARLAGNARNERTTWSWSVSRAGIGPIDNAARPR
ncbi:MAG: caspase family protein [Planctomycetes bacterium]|nr:caspase family protein [Planctomycetota bacterium]